MARKERQSTDVTRRFANILASRVQDKIQTGKTQKEIADEIGIMPSQLSDYINDKKTPTIDVFYKLCDYFNMSADYALGLMSEVAFEISKRAEDYIGLNTDAIDILHNFKNSDQISLMMIENLIRYADKENPASFLHGFYHAYINAVQKFPTAAAYEWDSFDPKTIDTKEKRAAYNWLLADYYINESAKRYKALLEFAIKEQWDKVLFDSDMRQDMASHYEKGDDE